MRSIPPEASSHPQPENTQGHETLSLAQALRMELHALPKIDLHRHLEGSLRLETLAEIALEHGIDLPSYDIETLRPYLQMTEEDPPGFHRFLQKFKLLRRFYTTREAVQRIAYESAADAAIDNVKYLELRFTPVALAQMQSFRYVDVISWVKAGVERAQREYDITVRLIVSVNRQEPDTAAEVIQTAIECRKENSVVGIDVAGDEVNFPLAPFIPVFEKALQEGMHVTVHAGEASGAHRVKEAIDLLDAKRIGHGVRCIENSSVVRLVRDNNVTLEVCPTSNLQTGVMRSWGHHPLPDLFRLGVRVTVNTDDPSISSTTLTDEYFVVLSTMRMQIDDLKLMLINSAQSVFLPAEEKAALEARFRTALKLNGGK